MWCCLSNDICLLNGSKTDGFNHDGGGNKLAEETSQGIIYALDSIIDAFFK